jgi:hypothetical protein
MLRVIAAFFAAPFVAWLSRALLFTPSYSLPEWDDLVSAVLRATLPIYLFALPFGFALFCVAWKLKQLGWLSAALAGGGIAFLFFAEPAFDVITDESLNTWYKSKVLIDASVEVLFGAWVGIVAWLLGVWRNPSLWKKRSHPVARSQIEF